MAKALGEGHRDEERGCETYYAWDQSWIQDADAAVLDDRVFKSVIGRRKLERVRSSRFLLGLYPVSIFDSAARGPPCIRTI